MRILRDDKSGTYTLVPTNSKEEKTIAALVSVSKPGDKMSYRGRTQDGNDENFVKVSFEANSRKKKVSWTDRRLGIIPVKRTWEEEVPGSGVTLVLQGTQDADKYEVNGIRNNSFFGDCGLIYLGQTMVDGKLSITVTSKRCKICNGNMITTPACEWSICDNCARKCKHVYKRGAIHGPGVPIAAGEFCTKCGRSKPTALKAVS